MKKVLMIILPIILLFSYTIVFADNTVKIKDISIEDVSDNTIINDMPNVDGLTFSTDLTFFEVNDFIKYKLEIVNESNEEIMISDDKSFNTNKYLDYSFSVDGDSIIKPNSSKTMYVTIKYNDEVNDSDLNAEGTYIYENNMQLNLSNLMDNPQTGHSNLFLSIISIIMIVFGVYMVIKYGKKETTLIIILSISLLPISVFAINTLKLKIDTNIIIEKNTPTFNICNYYSQNQCSKYRYKENMTWSDWLNSKYNYNDFNYKEEQNECSPSERFLLKSVPRELWINHIPVPYSEKIESIDYYTGIGHECS